MTATLSPGSISRQQMTKFASALPVVTSTCSGETPEYKAAMRSRRRSVPFDWL